MNQRLQIARNQRHGQSCRNQADHAADLRAFLGDLRIEAGRGARGNQLRVRGRHVLARKGHERFVCQLLQRDRLALCQPVRVRQRAHQAVVLVAHRRKQGFVVGQRRAQHAHVQVSPLDAFQLVARSHFEHPQLDLGIVAPELADQVRHEAIPGAADIPQGQLADVAAGCVLGAFDGYAFISQPLIGLFKEYRARRSKRHAALIAHEQRRTHVRFQLLDGLA
ncbi:hypothetical protein G6F22_015844 [Rhizopus arrhizus]|nr:hypothetical protein G6F22_015844 [Rhizopus arrhizus]